MSRILIDPNARNAESRGMKTTQCDVHTNLDPITSVNRTFIDSSHQVSVNPNLQAATIKATAISLFALFALATALPAPQDPAPPKAAAKTTHFYICTEPSFKGACTNRKVKLGECYGVGEAWNDKISSLGPDNGTSCAAFP
ncbi:hypothetical protein K458DRAFT_389650 [Lentithecium fluviatile CBS 122367]|uniref:Uncharacterized protein n=1 Tax=Lentithecium fluviatile CBS 122367 TaxID=1168545 RepID=A0A6G1IZP8_9PLEO|nr:hypothetical protein K458DRAFT_389650 [Lentithecium fluviatile CBS 122367]